MEIAAKNENKGACPLVPFDRDDFCFLQLCLDCSVFSVIVISAPPPTLTVLISNIRPSKLLPSNCFFLLLRTPSSDVSPVVSPVWKKTQESTAFIKKN